MKYTPLAIPDVFLIEPQVFIDLRGFFMETWREDEFNLKITRKTNVADYTFVQDNHSKSSRGILRGLHYQIKNPQGKLIRVTSGKIFDVVVDLRKNSPTFCKWIGIVLSSDNKKMLWIPPGFAHGFYVLSEAAEFIYKCTDYYAPKFEKCIKWDDSTIEVDWPVPPGEAPILSEKDKLGVTLANAEVFYENTFTG